MSKDGLKEVFWLSGDDMYFASIPTSIIPLSVMGPCPGCEGEGKTNTVKSIDFSKSEYKCSNGRHRLPLITARPNDDRLVAYLRDGSPYRHFLGAKIATKATKNDLGEIAP